MPTLSSYLCSHTRFPHERVRISRHGADRPSLARTSTGSQRSVAGNSSGTARMRSLATRRLASRGTGGACEGTSSIYVLGNPVADFGGRGQVCHYVCGGVTFSVDSGGHTGLTFSLGAGSPGVGGSVSSSRGNVGTGYSTPMCSATVSQSIRLSWEILWHPFCCDDDRTRCNSKGWEFTSALAVRSLRRRHHWHRAHVVSSA